MLKRSTITLILRFPQNSVTEKDLQKQVTDPLIERLHHLSTGVSANCSSRIVLDPTKSIQECVEEYKFTFVVSVQAYIMLSSTIASLIDSMYVDEQFFPLISSDIRVEIESTTIPKQQQIPTKSDIDKLHTLALEVCNALDMDCAVDCLSEETQEAYNELCAYRSGGQL